ncbi:MAG: ABC transporter ATP-binding protein [Ilumatobacteraceae bacterium]
MTAAHVHVESLTKHYGDRRALDGLDLLAQGGIVTVLGANGAGKTTLLRCLATILEPDSGSITIDGLRPDREAERIEIRRRLGYLPQDLGFDQSSTAFDVLDYLAVLKDVADERTRRRQVFDVLDRVGLRDRAGEKVGELSGGMRQRLGVAQAILASPTLLVLDEPGGGLDPDERLRLREIVAERRRAATIVVSTHLTDEAAIGDSVLVLVDGRIRFTGSPSSLAERAAGRTWLQDDLPPPGVRASWRRADGRHRCLGTPPPGAELVAPTLEDGYLLVSDTPVDV